MKTPMSFEPDSEVLANASVIVPAERAVALRELTRWKNGGCLTIRQRPDIPDVTEEEDDAINTVWNTIPNGSSCWSTALDCLCDCTTTAITEDE